MRKVLGVSKPFVRPADFEGEVVGLQDSAVADASLRALGATPRPVPSRRSSTGSTPTSNSSALSRATPTTGREVRDRNVNLWPRPLVIVMDKEVFASLTPEQQSALREAATAAIPEALAASRAEDEEACPSSAAAA